MLQKFLENFHVMHVAPSGLIAAAGDYQNGAANQKIETDVINIGNFEGVAWLVITTHNASGGDATLKVVASDGLAMTTTTAISFSVRAIWAAATTGGDSQGTVSTNIKLYTTTTAVNYIYVVEADAADVAAAGDGYKHVYLEVVQDTDNAVGGAICAIGYGRRYKEDVESSDLD